MDVRHETSRELVINNLIQYLNQLILSQTDALAKDEKWREHLVMLCKTIYSFTGMTVDYEHVFSNKNLLSIDIVLLPESHNISTMILNNQDRFNSMVSTLITELNTNSFNTFEVQQKCDMLAILETSEGDH
jgi:hypothetical protein